MKEDSKKDAEALQIHRRALQAYSIFSRREEATNVKAEVPTYEDEEDSLFMSYALHSGVNLGGLIPV